MARGPVLRGERVGLRPIEPADIVALAAILREPEVARWYFESDPDAAARGFLDDAETVALAIERDGRLVGSIQFTEVADPDHRHAGIDLFLTTASQGQGLGPDALRTLARYLFEERGHHRLVIDPALANERAIRAYEGVGFRRVGVMRRYERGADGSFHDGLLLDLLADELTR